MWAVELQKRHAEIVAHVKISRGQLRGAVQERRSLLKAAELHADRPASRVGLRIGRVRVDHLAVALNRELQAACAHVQESAVCESVLCGLNRNGAVIAGLGASRVACVIKCDTALTQRKAKIGALSLVQRSANAHSLFKVSDGLCPGLGAHVDQRAVNHDACVIGREGGGRCARINGLCKAI